jgi:hypothetical protein
MKTLAKKWNSGMLYSVHNAGLPGQKPSFTITVADETMTWFSSPPGHDLETPMCGVYMTRGGPPGSGKRFDLFPGGRAQLSSGG